MLATLAAICSSAGCSQHAQATLDPSAGDTFRIASPTVADAVYERAYVAELRAKRRVEIRSRIKGLIEAVWVDEGEAVDAGQLLFSVNVTELKQQDQIARAAIARAEAGLKTAELERDSARLLFDEDVVSAAELALADSKVQSAKAMLAEARATRDAINLEYARVLAPFAGVINRIPLKVGSAVDGSKPLTTLTDTSEIYAYFRVSETEYLQYTSAGSALPEQVWLRLADGSIYPNPGRVDAIESEFDRDTGSIAFRARFPNESDRLKHGGTGTVIAKTELPSAVMIPQKSTFEVQEQLYVYVVDEAKTAHARRIVPKLRLENSFVIASGLEKTDRFVLEGTQKLEDGMRVEPMLPAAAPGT